ncbi:transposase [Petroclostridium xylanilyticum]|uniref:transposase n=1 Tax=Petroclostridium xylanilyticum TaxID=1792311 RepID=UPI000B98E133|nr:transposase [Petroclostridium xylanilyticum]
MEEFIGKLMMHIPPKHFKMVRRYGVYAGSIQQKVKKCFGLLKYIKSGLKGKQYTLKDWWDTKDRALTWRALMINNFSKDPLKCKKCGETMDLWEIWHYKYGYIYDFVRT